MTALVERGSCKQIAPRSREERRGYEILCDRGVPLITAGCPILARFLRKGGIPLPPLAWPARVGHCGYAAVPTNTPSVKLSTCPLIQRFASWRPSRKNF